MQLDSGGRAPKMSASSLSLLRSAPLLLLLFVLPSILGAALPLDDDDAPRWWDDVAAAVIEEANRAVDGDYDANEERGVEDVGDAERKQIFEIAKKVAALELANARLGNVSLKRGKVDDHDDEIVTLQKQVDSNKAQIKQLQKLLGEIIDKVCQKKGDDCPENPWKTKTTTPVPTEVVVATTETVPAPTTAAPQPTTTKAKPVVTKAPTTTEKAKKTTPSPPKTTLATTTTKAKKTTAAVTTTIVTTTTTTTKKQPDPKGDCGKPDAPQNGHTDSDKTTLNSKAKVFCNPGYDLIGDNKRICTALWNKQNGEFDYYWAPPLSVVCKPNGKPIAKPTPAPTKKPTTKPTKKTTTKKPMPKPKPKPKKEPTTKPVTKAKAKAKAVATPQPKTKPGKKEAVEAREIVDEIEELEKFIEEEERELETIQKRKFRQDWTPDFASLPKRCTEEPEPDSCHYGWYFSRREGRCDTLFSCQTQGQDKNFFWSKQDCYDMCESYLQDGYNNNEGRWHSH